MLFPQFCVCVQVKSPVTHGDEYFETMREHGDIIINSNNNNNNTTFNSSVDHTLPWNSVGTCSLKDCIMVWL